MAARLVDQLGNIVLRVTVPDDQLAKALGFLDRVEVFALDILDQCDLERLAIVYVRQSTPQQIERNQESTRLLLMDYTNNTLGKLRMQITIACDTEVLSHITNGMLLAYSPHGGVVIFNLQDGSQVSHLHL